jgi:hypothetical protein
MEPATIELIKTIATDAIKIPGSASIAAWATYRASKAQFELKLKELESTHQFTAREHLFRYYKERQTQLAQDYAKLKKSLEGDLGFVAGFTESLGDENSGLVKIMAEYVEFYSTIAPAEIDVTMRDMEKNDLAKTSDYDKLKSYKDKISNLNTQKTFRTLQKNVFVILEVYHFLQHCNQMLLQAQMERMFGKYLEG